MASRFLRSFVALVLGVCSLQANAIEFRGAEYEVYIGDVNGDGINDVYLKVPDIFVLLHGDISVPLFISSDEPSFLIESLDAQSPLYLDPVVDESVDVSTLTKSSDIVSLIDVNGDGVLDLNFTSPSIIYDFSLDGGALEQPLIVATVISVPTLNKAAVDPVDDDLSEDDYPGLIKSNSFVGKNGAFNIEVPIPVSPGINGIQPKVSLSYNSHAGNGIVGWGWNLKTGASGIGRCKADLVRDGYVSGIQTGDHFKFCIDGSRLVEVADRKFRTEKETFSRIVSHGGTASDPDYWTVEYPNGSTFTYGNEVYAKKYDGSISGRDEARRYWHLNRVEDLSGNHMSYVYHWVQDSVIDSASDQVEERVQYLSSISYGKNGAVDLQKSVSFHYGDRPDKREYYIGGEFVLEHVRLTSIEVSQNDEVMSAFRLEYAPDSGGELPTVSQLVSIEKCLVSSSVYLCDAKKKFEWPAAPEEIAETGHVDKLYFGVGDFDGDGELDTLKMTFHDEVISYDGELWAVETTITPAKWQIDKVSVDDPEDSTPWLIIPADDVEFSVRPQIMDINGDGFDDLVYTDGKREDGYKHSVRVLRSTGSGFVYEVWADPGLHFGTDKRFSKRFFDINGDGLTDLIVMHFELGIQVRLNNGNGGFSDWDEWWPAYEESWDKGNLIPGQPFAAMPVSSFVDMNGDGLLDFVACDHDQICGIKDGVNYTQVLENIGDGFFASQNKWIPNESINGLTYLSDLNGDGLPDWLSFDENFLNVQLNSGRGFLPEEPWLPIIELTEDRIVHLNAPVNGENNRVRVASQSITFVDINRDGCKDLLARKYRETAEKYAAAGYVALSTCSGSEGFLKLRKFDSFTRFFGLNNKDEDNQFTGVLPETGYHTSPLFPVDVNRDGVYEISGDTYVRFLNISPRLIMGVSDSHNNTVGLNDTSVYYSRLSNSEIYTGDGSNTADGINQDGSAFKNVVTRSASLMLVDQITSEGLPTRTFQYKNYLRSVVPWGPRSFESVVETLYPTVDFFVFGGGDHGVDSSLDYVRTERVFNQEASDDVDFSGLLKSVRVYNNVGDSDSENLISRSLYSWKSRIYLDDADRLSALTLAYNKPTLETPPIESVPLPSLPDASPSPHYFSYLYETVTETWDIGGQKIGLTKSGDAGASLSTCAISGDSSLLKVNEGAEGDVDYSSSGLRLHKRDIACDELGKSASAIYSAIKVSSYEDRVSGEWLLGLPKKVEMLGYVGAFSLDVEFDVSAGIRVKSYTYNTLGQLETETIEPDNEDLRLATTYDYNAFGTRSSTTQSWLSEANDGLDYGGSRISALSESYSENAELTTVITNPLQQDVTSKVEPKFGNIVSSISLNNLETTFDFDNYGRVVSALAPGDITTSYQYKLCDSCFSYNDSAFYYVTTKTTGQAASRVYFDVFDREVGSRTKSIDGEFIYTYKTYDLVGRVTASSAPFFASETAAETAFVYDLLGRNTSTTFADSSSSNIIYAGLKKTITNRDGQSRKVTVNMAGWDVEAEDAAETKLTYEYNHFGDLTTTTVNEDDSTQVSIGYDLLGRRTSLDDPDAGFMSYTLNPLGLVAKEIDANGTVTRYSYDELDRVVSRTDDADTTSAQTHQWVFDNKLHGLGMLGSLRGFDSDGGIYNEEYSFTSLSLQEDVTVTIDGVSYVTHTHYDNFQRIKGLTYPTGFTYQNEYNAYGYLNRTEKLDGSLLWRSNTMDARGNFTQFEYGNSVVSDQTFDPNTGAIETINARVNGDGYTVQDHEYDFSSLGNLNYRIDHKFGITESFCYDSMNRIKAARIGSCSESDTDFTYDVLGNIRSKDGVSDYAYASGRPHAVSRYDGSNYEYDDAGQMLSGGGRSISYTAFGKPSYFSKGNNWASFTYDANKNRIARKDSNGKDTTYIGLGFYEINRSNDDTQHIHYIGDYARYVIETGLINDDYFVYLHRDHLSSIVAETGENISFISTTSEWMGFSPWGERLSQDWSGSELGESYVPDSSRGFTDHEHIDGVGLIHMNGRVYDPVIGRFLTPDPLVQAPNNTQSYNRYSYVFNNPLSFVDPSGYESDPIIYDGDVIGQDIGNIMEVQALYYTIDGASSPEPFAVDMTISPASSIIVTLGAGAVACPVICSWAVGVGSFISDPSDPLNLLGGWLKSVKLFKWFGRGKTAGQIGRAGEDAVSAAYDIGKKQKFSINGRNRIPDGVTSTTLSEVKNVKSLSYTKQLRDFADIAKQQGLKYDLYVRPSTKLSGPLSQAIENGVINLKFIPGAK